MTHVNRQQSFGKTRPMSQYRISPKQVEARGEDFYRQVREQVDPENHGKFVVIDVETGDFEVDQEDVVATMRLLAKNPAAVTYGIRIGYPAAYTLGSRAIATR